MHRDLGGIFWIEGVHSEPFISVLETSPTLSQCFSNGVDFSLLGTFGNAWMHI